MGAVGYANECIEVRKVSELVPLTAIGTIPGVRILHAAGRNGAGTGMIDGTATRLRWRAPGSATFGVPVTCGADGTYLLADGEDANKTVRCQVVAAYLQASASAAVYLREKYGEPFSDIPAVAAKTSWSVTLQCTIVNVARLSLSDLRVWVEEAGTITGIGTDGSTWYLPTSEDHADVLTWPSVAPDEEITLHVRCAGNASSADPAVENELRFAFNGL